MRTATLLLVLLCAASHLYAAPRTDDVTTLSVPDGTTVVIYRDLYGVPHIQAATEVGVFYGQGYAVAEDRLFQLETFRRAALGRLSEVGLGSVETDQLIRTVFYTPAERQAQFDALSPRARGMVENYVAGINAYLDLVRQDPLTYKPIEFFALGFDPAPWTIDDVVATVQFFMRRFGSRGGEELDRLVELGAFGPVWFETYRPLNDPTVPTTIPDESAAAQVPSKAAPDRRPMLQTASDGAPLRISPDVVANLRERRERAEAELAELRVPSWGSFAVLIGTAKSNAESVMLLGAPQLDRPQLGNVNNVNEVELQCPTLHLSGMTIAGLPGVLVGRNQHHAWTLTSGISDNIDTFIEVLSPNGMQYLHDAAFRDFEVIFEPDLGYTHFRTVHGPVIGATETQAFSYQYAFWGRELSILDTVFPLWTGERIEDAEETARNLAINTNLLYADADRNIQYWHVGNLLRHIQTYRPDPGNPACYDPADASCIDPRLPRLGDGSQDWDEEPFLDFAELPGARNPQQGYLVNWNNKPAPGWRSGDNTPYVDQVEDLLATCSDDPGAPLTCDEVRDRLDRTTRVNQINSYIEPLPSVSFEALQAVPANIPDRGPIRIWQRGTYEQVVEFFADAPEDGPSSRELNIVAPGQSGFISVNQKPDPHYADQWALYVSFTYKDMVFTRSRSLWPPDHTYHTFDVRPYTDAAPPEDVQVVAVWSDEPENGPGDGNTNDDIILADAQTARLRAERSGEGNGRVYTVHTAAPNALGALGTEALIRVVVPRGHLDPFTVDDGPAYVVRWNADPQAPACPGGCAAVQALEDQQGPVVLQDNYPDPFNPKTKIRFQMPEAGLARLTVYDVLGREIARLVDASLPAGAHEVAFEATDLPSGIYLYRLEAMGVVKTKIMTLLR